MTNAIYRFKPKSPIRTIDGAARWCVRFPNKKQIDPGEPGRRMLALDIQLKVRKRLISRKQGFGTQKRWFSKCLIDHTKGWRAPTFHAAADYA